MYRKFPEFGKGHHVQIITPGEFFLSIFRWIIFPLIFILQLGKCRKCRGCYTGFFQSRGVRRVEFFEADVFVKVSWSREPCEAAKDSLWDFLLASVFMVRGFVQILDLLIRLQINQIFEPPLLISLHFHVQERKRSSFRHTDPSS